MTFTKLLPHVKLDVFKESMNAFKLTGPRDFITRSDFEAVFSETKTYIPHSQSMPKKNPSKQTADSVPATA